MTSLNGNQRAARDMTASLPRRITLGSLAAISFTVSLMLSVPVRAADGDDDATQLGKLVVTARNREEIAQDVPLPVQVIGGVQLERDGVVSVWDLPGKAPNLQLNPPGEN